MSAQPRHPAELVPLTLRIRNLQLLRAAAVIIVMVFAFASGALDGRESRELVATAAAYGAITLTAETYWRLSNKRGLVVLGFLLIVDGVFLGWVSFATGMAHSPLRYLLLVHPCAVALLASYRTGVKAALSHSLLLVVIHHAHEAGLIVPLVDAEAPQSRFVALITLIAALWFMTIATASFSAVNERELRRRRYDLEALTALADALDSASGADDVMRTLLDHLHDAFDFRRGVVVAAQDGDMRVMASYREPWGAPARRIPTYITESDVIALASDQHRPVLVRQLDRRREPQLSALLPEAHNLLVCPLVAEGRAFGAVILEHDPRRSRIEQRLLAITERFSSHAALTLQNAWLLEKLQAIASTDALTGLRNRRTFDNALQQQLSRPGAPISLVMMDIDHFKDLNDTHGHQAGDAVLREVGAVVRETCPDLDLAARYGGEEFAVILPATEQAEAGDVAERLRRAVEDGDTSIRVTVSVGVASGVGGQHTAETLIAAADGALYQSKRAGRNQVTIAGAAGPRGIHAVGAADVIKGAA